MSFSTTQKLLEKELEFQFAQQFGHITGMPQMIYVPGGAPEPQLDFGDMSGFSQPPPPPPPPYVWSLPPPKNHDPMIGRGDFGFFPKPEPQETTQLPGYMYRSPEFNPPAPLPTDIQSPYNLEEPLTTAVKGDPMTITYDMTNNPLYDEFNITNAYTPQTTAVDPGQPLPQPPTPEMKPPDNTLETGGIIPPGDPLAAPVNPGTEPPLLAPKAPFIDPLSVAVDPHQVPNRDGYDMDPQYSGYPDRPPPFPDEALIDMKPRMFPHEALLDTRPIGPAPPAGPASPPPTYGPTTGYDGYDVNPQLHNAQPTTPHGVGPAPPIPPEAPLPMAMGNNNTIPNADITKTKGYQNFVNPAEPNQPAIGPAPPLPPPVIGNNYSIPNSDITKTKGYQEFANQAPPAQPTIGPELPTVIGNNYSTPSTTTDPIAMGSDALAGNATGNRAVEAQQEPAGDPTSNTATDPGDEVRKSFATEAVAASGIDPTSDMASRFINFVTTAPYHNPKRNDIQQAWNLWQAGVVDPRISRNPNRNTLVAGLYGLLGRDQTMRRFTEQVHNESAQAWMAQNGPNATETDGKGFTLKPNEKRYDASGNEIAHNEGGGEYKVVNGDLVKIEDGVATPIYEDKPNMAEGDFWQPNIVQQSIPGGPVRMQDTDSGTVSVGGDPTDANPTRREVVTEKTDISTMSDGQTGKITTVTPSKKVQEQATTDAIAENRVVNALSEGAADELLHNPVEPAVEPTTNIPYQGKGERPLPPPPPLPRGTLQDVKDYYADEAPKEGEVEFLPGGAIHNNAPKEAGDNWSKAHAAEALRIVNPNLTAQDALTLTQEPRAKTEAQVAYEQTMAGRTKDGRQYNAVTGKYDMIVGGKAWNEWKNAVSDARGTINSSLRTLTIMSEMAKNVAERARKNPNATGLVGEFLKEFGGTDARDLAAMLKVLQSNAGFDKLHALRNAREGGGGVGNVTEREFEFMVNSITALDQGLTGEALAQQVERLVYHTSRWQAARQLELQYYLKQEGEQYHLQPPSDPDSKRYYMEVVTEAHKTAQFAERAEDIVLARDRQGNLFPVTDRRDAEILWQREQMYREGHRKFKSYYEATFSEGFLDNYTNGATVNATAP